MHNFSLNRLTQLHLALVGIQLSRFTVTFHNASISFGMICGIYRHLLWKVLA
ncbi:hypothetical protein HNR06_001015 [Nocardiopsis arvandica]|uniref:Uncharacterized protein n=1 Tax=Nocardiopsis sinuspersici TaxID=501010 RepID=A0A7Y9X8Z7_9ACTN|nr:hypothetical protein [Nocardiopsis sinuspersici]